MLTMTTGTGAGGKVSVPRLVLTGTRHPGCSSEIQVEHSPRLDTRDVTQHYSGPLHAHLGDLRLVL